MKDGRLLFRNLPIYIYVEIFSYLNVFDFISLLRVCKDWQEDLVSTPLFWKTIPFINISKRLVWAIKNEYNSVIEALEERLGGFNNIDREGNSFLWKCCIIGNIRVVHYLISARKIPVENDTGKTSPLWIAASYGHDPIVEFLLNHGADIKFKTEEGVTPLWRACQQGHSLVVEVLLKHDSSNINDMAKWGAIPTCTPFWIAASEGEIEVLKVLMKYKANTELKSSSNRTPIQAAMDSLHSLGRETDSMRKKAKNCKNVIKFLSSPQTDR